ncbi:hypothetical protein VC895_25105 [Citrobacter freundii]|nr:hypothetical protein [Citrobacter freundii]
MDHFLPVVDTSQYISDLYWVKRIIYAHGQSTLLIGIIGFAASVLESVSLPGKFQASQHVLDLL